MGWLLLGSEVQSFHTPPIQPTENTLTTEPTDPRLNTLPTDAIDPSDPKLKALPKAGPNPRSRWTRGRIRLVASAHVRVPVCPRAESNIAYATALLKSTSPT